MRKKGTKNKTSIAATRMGTWKPVFIEALRENGTVYRAAKIANISRRTAALERHRDPEFSSDWNDALEDYKETLEEEVDRQGKKGNIIGLMFRLKRLDPMYRDRIDVNLDYPEQFKKLIEKYNLTIADIKNSPVLAAAASRWNAIGVGGNGGEGISAEKTS